MILRTVLLAGLLRWLPGVSAQLPYIPTQLILSPDGATLYQFTNIANGSALLTLDAAGHIDPTGQVTSLNSLPFSTSQTESFVSIADSGGVNLLVGNCQDEADKPTLWRMSYNSTGGNSSWTQYQLQRSDDTFGASFLSAGFSFTATGAEEDTGRYVFGGMCPQGGSNATSWTSSATYSNNMLLIAPKSGSDYDLSGKSSPPVAEAGLTITPLEPVVSYSSAGKMSQKQSFVLLGGHTSTAFINMSQVAVFSLPDANWAFKGVNQPIVVQGELNKRDELIVEPRSGHSAVLSEDGSKIFVVGGWVGDVTNPASPQFAILDMDDQHDASSTWSWRIPSQDGSPFSMTSGVYGHGAVMLKGGVMMVTGGTAIRSSKRKRDSQQHYFYNTTSSTWIFSYTNPNSSINGSADRRHTSSKIGLGAGLGVGLTAVVIIAVAGFLLARRRKQKRLEREKRLRAMALGSGKYRSGSQISAFVAHTEHRSTGWDNAQQRQIEHIGQAVSWPLPNTLVEKDTSENSNAVEHSGFDVLVPGSMRGSRRNLHSDRPLGNHSGHVPVGPGSVFRIDEEEEIRSIKSYRTQTATSRRSDPFKDPHTIDTVNADAEGRKREVKGWVEDWQSAAINLSRSPSQARTYSNLSQAHSSLQSESDRGRLSPDKTDRTGSNLSERSTLSNQSSQSNSGFGRTLSLRSVSAGYALFAGAAAAMGRITGSRDELDRSTSKRSMSMGSAHRYGGPTHADHQALLRDESPTKSEHGAYYTPPESPIKDYKNYSRRNNFTSRSRTRGVLGSVKRVFTGTSQVDVDARVEHYEEKEKEIQEEAPEIIQTTPHGTTIAFWQGKKGARDWEPSNVVMGNSTIRRRSGGRPEDGFDRDDYDGEDWDVETAIQKRVVQVMFTVPKEKLRVVNADTLSLISRSDIGDKDDETPEMEVKRMSSVKEADEREHEPDREKTH